MEREMQAGQGRKFSPKLGDKRKFVEFTCAPKREGRNTIPLGMTDNFFN